MSLILNIDTSLDTAIVSLARKGSVIQLLQNNRQQDHAAFLHTAVKNIFESAALHMENIDAVAVAEGPGSYTGLRIGMSAAKGFCYALQKPLITINTLALLASAAIAEHENSGNILLAPMIDARRMEVFTAVYTWSMENVLIPQAMVLEPNSFEALLERGKVGFLGNGALKWQPISKHPNALFLPFPSNLPATFSNLSYSNFSTKKFASLSFAEPLYIKEFFSNS